MNHTKPRYALSEAFQLLGIARSVGYVRIREGALHIQKDGRRSFVTAAELDRYVAGQQQTEAAQPAPPQLMPIASNLLRAAASDAVLDFEISVKAQLGELLDRFGSLDGTAKEALGEALKNVLADCAIDFCETA